MKSIIKGIAVAVGFALVASCANPVSGGSGGGGGGGIDTSSANSIIAAIPERTIQLPASLQEQSGSSGSGIGASAYNAEAFTDFGSQPGVKANGWYDVTNAASGDENMAQFFTKMIKAVGEKHTLNFDTDIDVGVVEFPPGLSGPNNETSMDVGVLRLDKLSETRFDVYWTVPYAAGDQVGTYYVSLELEVKGESMATTVYLMLEPEGESLFLQDYAIYDPTTGESSSYWYAPWDKLTFRQFYQEDGGTIRFGERYQQDSDVSKSVAWANDDYGGVAWSEDNGADGNYAGVEIYDGNGFLVMESWGQEELTHQIEWLRNDDTNYRDNTIDLSEAYPQSAPGTIEVVQHDDGSGTGPEVLVDGEVHEYLSTTVGDAEDAGNHIWRWTWNPNDWGSGAVYYHSSEWNYDDATQTSSVTFTPGYVVPEPTTFLGTTTYQENSFPLRYVEADRDGYTLQRLQTGPKETYTVEWEENDETVSRDYTWTPYDWWLENDEATDNSSEEFNREKGDISVDNIQEREYWVWDHDEGKSVKNKLLMLSSSKDDPDNFSPTSAAQGVIAA
ncbi:MAG: hypothetical protein ACOCWS_04880, partial [Alkalispirochaetaceae bacterium]